MKLKKILTIILSLVILLCVLPFGAFTVNAATSGYTYAVLNGEATITGIDSSISGELVIPSTIDGYTVTSIGNSAFYKCSSLTSITIPDSVTSIGSYAFYNCNKLTSVTIPDSVKSIAYNAFYCCSSLKNVYITDIAAWCNIDFDTSYNCYSNPLYYANNLYLNDKPVTDVVIPDGVTEIQAYLLVCDSLSSVVIPDSVRSIDDYAFEYCRNLTSVTIGNSVTSIGSYAFNGCGSLNSVIIPDSVTDIGDNAFSDCSSLTSATIGKSVISIGGFAFYNCSKLASVTIPDSVTSIGYGAFYDCASLENVYFLGTEEQWQSIAIEGYNSCLTDSEIIFACSCGCTEFSEWIIVSEASCSNVGILQQTCQQCGEIRTKTVPQTSHNLLNGICSICGIEIITIESAHPYENNEDISEHVTVEGAIQLEITFGAETVTESGYDHIYIYDGEGIEIGKYSGTALASKTIIVDGDTVTIRLISDSSTTQYGYLAEIRPIYPEIEVIYGDTNGDGDINSFDLTQLRIALLLGDTDYSDNVACDINGDGEINIIDLVRLKKYLAGYEVTLGKD